MSHTQRKVTCRKCFDRGYEHRIVGRVAGGVPVYVETDRPCRRCARKAREWMREAKALVKQADDFLAIPKGW